MTKRVISDLYKKSGYTLGVKLMPITILFIYLLYIMQCSCILRFFSIIHYLHDIGDLSKRLTIVHFQQSTSPRWAPILGVTEEVFLGPMIFLEFLISFFYISIKRV